MQYKLDLWSKYGFDLKRLLLPQLPLDRHLNVLLLHGNNLYYKFHDQVSISLFKALISNYVANAITGWLVVLYL